MLNEQLIEQIPRLRRYAKALCGPNSAQEPDDLVQDCLERALIYQESWTPGTNLRAWLFTILHNLYVNQWRHQRRGPEVLSWGTELEKISAVPQEDGVELVELERAGARRLNRDLGPVAAELLLLHRAADQEPRQLIGEQRIQRYVNETIATTPRGCGQGDCTQPASQCAAARRRPGNCVGGAGVHESGYKLVRHAPSLCGNLISVQITFQ